MKEIYVYGCGGVGSELAELLSNDPRFKFMGFIDDNREIRTCMEFETHTFEETVTKINSLPSKESNIINVIISIGEPAIREEVSRKIARHDNLLKEVVVDLSEHFNPALSTVGAGTLLHKGSYISVYAHIGKCCMINKGALVGHGCSIGDYSVLAPNVTLGGDVKVGNRTYIGSNAVLRNGIRIGKNVIIGIGAVVIDDVDDEVVVAGNPAKVLRKNENHRVFVRKLLPPPPESLIIDALLVLRVFGRHRRAA